MGIGKNLLVLSGALSCAAFHLPAFVTSRQSWIPRDYPYIIAIEGAGIVFALPMINAILSLLWAAMRGLAGFSPDGRILGALSTMIGVATIGVIIFLEDLLVNLFFGWDYINSSHGSGAWLLLVAAIISVIGGIIIFTRANGGKVKVAKVKTDTPAAISDATATAATASADGLRKRTSADKPIKVPGGATASLAGDKKKKEKKGSFVTGFISFIIAIAIMAYIASILIPTSYLDPVVDVTDLVVPEGFKIDVFASHVYEARSMAVTDNEKMVFVSSRLFGNVYAIIDDNNDKKADRVVQIMHGKTMPNGAAFRNGALYIAEVSKIWRFDDIEAKVRAIVDALPPQYLIVPNISHKLTPTLLTDAFPTDTHHGWKYIQFGPDNLMYIPVGCPCNICRRPDTRYSTIMRQKAVDVWDFEIFAEGVRNSVGFDWHPITKELWFTENGRDWAASDFPPDELNRAPRAGLHFGFPQCVGNNVRDDEADRNVTVNCATAGYVPAVFDLTAHPAALAIKFYTGSMFPAEYTNRIFIAEHGSWNRGPAPVTGYRVSTIDIDAHGAVVPGSYRTFISFVSPDGRGHGRPVDLHIMKDGSLLLSDDVAHRIYRITYQS